MANKNKHPPKWADIFLSWFCSDEVLETLQGDLYELYEKRFNKSGRLHAELFFILDVFSACRPFAFKRQKNNYTNRWALLSHHVLVARRSIMKDKTYSFINIFGLVAGITAALLLGKYIGFSLIVDSFHTNKDQIYFVQHQEIDKNLQTITQNSTYRGLGDWAKERFPDIKSFSRFEKNVETLVKAINEEGITTKFNERRICMVDSSFLDIFSFTFVQGNPASALTKPNTIVLTESMANKYFNGDNAVGKTLHTSLPWGEEGLYLVTGVIKDVSVHSSLQFDFLKSSVGTEPDDLWHYPVWPTYFLIDEQANTTELIDKINSGIGKIDVLNQENKQINLDLICIGDAHLSEVELLLALVGVFILVITWINFINLTAAKAMQRFKESGLRKVMGSTRAQLTGHFIFQGFIVNSAAFVIALCLAWLLSPFLNIFTFGHMLPLINDPTLLNVAFLGVFIFGAFLSSFYPAVLISSINPIQSLKGQFATNGKDTGLRKALVIIQFCISVILIIGIFVISQQMQFMQDQELGVDLGRTLVVKTTKDGWGGKMERFQTFKNKINNLSVVEAATSSTTVPGNGAYQEMIYTVDKSNEMVMSNLMGIAKTYISYFNIKILAGKDFSEGNFRANRRSIILNRSAALSMGFEDLETAIDQSLTNHENGHTYTIIGVVNDFHQKSMKEKIDPMTFVFNPFRGHVSIRIDSTNYSGYEALGNCITSIENIWNEIYPDQPFDYYFLDEQFNAQYRDDIRFKTLFGLFAGISMLIACLGLFGLSIYVSSKRKKEVGIRKVHGASSFSVVSLFCKDYLKQIIIAIFIGTPVAYYMMNAWLESYSYRTSITLWTIIIPSLLLVLLSLFTVGFQTVKVSLINPATTLKEE